MSGEHAVMWAREKQLNKVPLSGLPFPAISSGSGISPHQAWCHCQTVNRVCNTGQQLELLMLKERAMHKTIREGTAIPNSKISPRVYSVLWAHGGGDPNVDVSLGRHTIFNYILVGATASSSFRLRTVPHAFSCLLCK